MCVCVCVCVCRPHLVDSSRVYFRGDLFLFSIISLFLVGCAEWTPRVGFHRLDLRLPIPIHVAFYVTEDSLCGPPLRGLSRRFDVQEIVKYCCLETMSLV